MSTVYDNQALLNIFKMLKLCLQNYENVSSEVWKIDPSKDVVTAANTRGEQRGPAEQILYDCYVSLLCFIHRLLNSLIFMNELNIFGSYL